MTTYRVYACSHDEPTRRVHMYTFDQQGFTDWTIKCGVWMVDCGHYHYSDMWGASWWVKRYEDLPR